MWQPQIAVMASTPSTATESYVVVVHYYQPEVAGFDIDMSVTSLTHSYTGQSVISPSVTSLTINQKLLALISTCLSHPLLTHILVSQSVSQFSLCLSYPLLSTTCCWLWYRRVCHIPYSLVHRSVSQLFLSLSVTSLNVP